MAKPVASAGRRATTGAVIGIIRVAAPLGVAVGLCVPTTEPPGPSQSSARSSRRRSPGETLQQWIGRYCTWKAFKSGDTWKNTFGEVGATRYDTYLSTYRSSIYLYRSSRLRSTRSSRSSQQIETPAQKYGFFFFLVPGQVSKDSLSGMQRATLRKNGSGDAWQVFKSGDTWRNTFGEVGATRYDTYLSTYRSSMDVYRTRRLPPRSMPKPSVDELLVCLTPAPRCVRLTRAPHASAELVRLPLAHAPGCLTRAPAGSQCRAFALLEPARHQLEPATSHPFHP